MFYKIINLIRINLILNNKIIKVKLLQKDFIILKIFLNLNIIKTIKYDKKNYYYIKLNNNNIFNNIKNLYKPSQPKNINLKELIKINKKKNNLFYMSTNKGVINNFEAEKNKIGGFLIMNIWI